MEIAVISIILFLDHLGQSSAMYCYQCTTNAESQEPDHCLIVSTDTPQTECEKCAVRLVSDNNILTGEIRRDCFSSMENCTEPECETCESELCNGSKFPADRISCHQCEGCDVATGDPLICPLYFPYKKMCYERIVENFVTRGCFSMPMNYCLVNGFGCVLCLTDGCNRSPKEREQNIQCYTCQRDTHVMQSLTQKCFLPQTMDLYKNLKVKTYTSTVPIGKALYCWTMFPSVNQSSIIRLNGMDSDFKYLFDKYCSVFGSNRSGCKRCAGSLCNSDGFYGTCFECLEHDGDCFKKPSLANAIECSESMIPTYGCYVHKILGNDSLIRRGCITDMTYYQYTFCDKNYFDCKFCQSKYCNRDFRKLSCYQCSELTDLGNVNYCRSELIREKQRDCPRNDDRCFFFDNGTYVARDCISYAFDLATSENTVFCETDLCNQMSRLGRIKCYSGTESEEKVKLCGVGEFGCYSVVFRDSSGVETFERGCYTFGKKYTKNQLNCDLYWQYCVVCTDNLCNIGNYYSKPRMKCIKCNDTDDCEFFKENRPLEDCTTPVRFLSDESCFYGIYKNHSVRGCTIDTFGTNSTPPRELSYCKSGGCNSGSLNTFYCITCESNHDDPDYCRTILDEKGQSLAPLSVCEGDEFYSVERKGCYTYQTPLDIVKRGCIRYLPEVIQKFCENPEQNICDVCLKLGCNTQEVSRGLSLNTSLIRVKLFILICILVFN